MNFREIQEKRELEMLCNEAAKSVDAKRKHEILKCDLRTEFQRDMARIIHSKAFRRLKHKTQVFLSPEGDHYRTRLTHTLEVAQISRTIARVLRLNEDLTEAIALGHDLGHTPFGHCGETVLNRLHPGGFRHNEQSARVVELLERSGDERGLNLTEVCIDGILWHSGKELPKSYEGMLVRHCDKVAYIHHDMDDSIRASLLDEGDVPDDIKQIAGELNSDRLDFFIHDLCGSFMDDPVKGFSAQGKIAFDKLHDFMHREVYVNPTAKAEEERAAHIVEALYVFFRDNPDKMPKSWFEDYRKYDVDAVKDYIASMSDRYAVAMYKSLFVPSFWS